VIGFLTCNAWLVTKQLKVFEYSKLCENYS
jgi:hypothetical protein